MDTCFKDEATSTSTYISLGMQFDEKSSSFEAELAYLGPRESVDANQVLKDEDSEVSD